MQRLLKKILGSNEMTDQKKRGRPRKDPLIAAVEAPKKRGRPAGTRAKHRVTVQSVKKNWENMYKDVLEVKDAARDEIIRLSVEITQKEQELEHFKQRANSAETHIKNLEQSMRAKEVRELKLFGIIEYLEDKVKNAIKSNSI